MTTTDVPRTPGRLALVTIAAASAALLLSGCGSAADPSAGPAAATGATASSGRDGSGPAPDGAVVRAPGSLDPSGATAAAAAGASTAPGGAQDRAHPAATAITSPAGNGGSAAAPDPGQSLAAIDRALADLDTQLTDADHDVATPEGDLR